MSGWHKEVIGNTTRIYALVDEGGCVRYVGKTVRTLRERFAQHKVAAKRGSLPVNRWIKKHDASIRLLETVPRGGRWQDRERYWISQFDNLLNLTEGGEGLPGHKFTESHKKKISDALKTGRSFECENCGRRFWRKLNEIRKGNCRFCSRECYAASLRGVHKQVPILTIARGVAAAAMAKRAMTHCKRGHPLSGSNVYRTKTGRRVCKECRKTHKEKYRSAHRG